MSAQIFSEQLISATGNTAMFNDSLIVHVSSPEAFASAHIPGAVLLTPMELVSGEPPATGKIAPPQRLAGSLERLGYRPEQNIVVYDDEGGGWAGRFIWTLEVIGHKNWQYLDGGLHAWAASGGELATGHASGSDNPSSTVQIQYDERLIANCDDLIDAVTRGDPELAIWDARSRAEHLGQRSGSARAGRIPGSAHMDWLDVMDRNNNLCLRKDLPECLAARGLTADKKLVVHCQTHHRSGLAYLAARLLNFPDVQGYDGSWSEWGNREDTPIETGVPAQANNTDNPQ